MADEYEHVEMSLHATKFPCEKTQIHEVRGKESISRLFWFDIEIVRLDEDELLPELAVGERASLLVKRGSEDLRRIHGVITHMEAKLDERVRKFADSVNTRFRTYKLRLMPTAHTLGLRRSQRIFVNETPVEVIKKTLTEAGLVFTEDYDTRVRPGNLASAPRAMIVQYAETDLAFISRLAEHHGISFFFEHDQAETGKDKLIFTDWESNTGFLQKIEKVDLRRDGDRRGVYELRRSTQRIAGQYDVDDYDYQDATKSLRSTARPPKHTAHTAWFDGKIIEYGPNYQDPVHGQELADIRAEELQVEQIVYTGASDQPQFSGGTCVNLREVSSDESRPNMSFDKDLLVVEVEHEAHFGVLMHGSASATQTGPDTPTTSDKFYRASFRAIPLVHMYRPARVTPKPRIHGLLTGMIVDRQVTDPTLVRHEQRNAKIDEDGRYWVQFLFEDLQVDRAAHLQTSLPIRMLQPHVGGDYGMHFPLKPGVEVLVGFLDGDPDRPLIVGAAHRPMGMPSPVRKDNLILNRLITESGVIIEIGDGIIPKK